MSYLNRPSKVRLASVTEGERNRSQINQKDWRWRGTTFYSSKKKRVTVTCLMPWKCPDGSLKKLEFYTPERFLKKTSGSENMKSSERLFLHCVFSLYGHNCHSKVWISYSRWTKYCPRSECTVTNRSETHKIFTWLLSTFMPADCKAFRAPNCVRNESLWSICRNIHILHSLECFRLLPFRQAQQFYLIGAAFSSNSCRNMFEKQETLLFWRWEFPYSHKFTSYSPE